MDTLGLYAQLVFMHCEKASHGNEAKGESSPPGVHPPAGTTHQTLFWNITPQDARFINICILAGKLTAHGWGNGTGEVQDSG